MVAAYEANLRMTFEMHKVVSLKRRYQSQFKQETHVSKSVIVTNGNILENKLLRPNPISWGCDNYIVTLYY